MTASLALLAEERDEGLAVPLETVSDEEDSSKAEIAWGFEGSERELRKSATLFSVAGEVMAGKGSVEEATTELPNGEADGTARSEVCSEGIFGGRGEEGGEEMTDCEVARGRSGGASSSGSRRLIRLKE